MNENELIELCAYRKKFTGIAPWVYWPVELYSHGKYIREYGFFPSFLPLGVYGDHSSGIQGSDIPAKHELETDAPFYLALSKAKAEQYQCLTGKKAFVITSPAVYYRRKNGIEKKPDAKGTLAYVAHSTPNLDIVTDFKQYAKALLTLPEKFQPVTVCLHMHDINKGLHNVFLSEGFEVVTAGNTSDYRFIERFYSILRCHAYSTSNMIGTYTSLSIEMGIPFFVFGADVQMENKSDKNLPYGLIGVYDDAPHLQLLHNELTFDNWDVKIDPKLKRFIEEKLGVFDGISRIKLCLILWIALLKLCLFTWFIPRFIQQIGKRAMVKFGVLKERKD